MGLWTFWRRFVECGFIVPGIWTVKVRGIEYDLCIVCEENTWVRHDEPVDNRLHYVEGCGQLCQECFRSLETTVDVRGIQYDLCILCDNNTFVPHDKPVEERLYYVEGCGQLCPDCFETTPMSD